MAAKKKKQYTTEELYNPQIDLNRDAYLYGRQSSKDQVIENIQSRISQTVNQLAYTKEYLGFRDDGSTGMVTLFIENQVIDEDGNVVLKNASGTWPIDRRPGLKTICDAIEHGTPSGKRVGVVIAEFVDRLFRDEDRIDSNVFIKICRENDCYVHISSKRMTYNFANPQHAELFRMEVLMASAYIENHVRNTMLKRRSLAAQSGLWAGVGSLPVGYIVDREKESPTRGKFIIYEPHAEMVRWLFRRFVELGYNRVKLAREVQGMSYIFPEFEEWVDENDKSRCNLRPQNGGYSLAKATLIRILTNEVYIGTFKREGVVRKQNHPAIVDEELFWLVYDHLRDNRPDGTPTNRIKLVRYTQYPKEDRPAAREALFCFTSDQPHVTIGFQRGNYEVRYYNGMLCDLLLVVDADKIEQEILKILFEKLRHVDLKHLEQQRKAVLAEKAKRIKKLEREVGVIDEEVATLTENMGKVKTDAVIAQLEARMAKLLVRKASSELEIEKTRQSRQATVLGTLEEELEDLELYWHKRSPTLKQALLSLLIERCTLDYISAHFYRVTIHWAHNEWGVDEGIFVRNKSNRGWSKEEDRTLRSLYAKKDVPDLKLALMQALPQRTWGSIVFRADVLGMETQKGARSRPDAKTYLSYEDLQFLEKSGLTAERFQELNGVIWSRLLSLVHFSGDLKSLLLSVRLLLKKDEVVSDLAM